tara:strand:+ start:1090 stop:1323 length:234 start_codon:yes stop_codon:yes gene_type:complete
LNEKTVALLTEVFFCEVYEGQKLFSETEMLLREQGFTFYGFTYLENRYKNKNFLNKKTLKLLLSSYQICHHHTLKKK